ncbi:MAG: transketolase C-terminal domain-containing protein [Patescibacteria group bacterium]|nr:transketolase family protein [Patescibacteria group bacterium]
MELNKNIYNKEPEVDYMRSGWGDALVELGKKHEEVVVFCADLADSVKVGDFMRAYPERYIETGIQEQNMMSAAAGMAHTGLKPYAATYAVFCPGRNWDQIRVSVAYPRAKVVFAGAHAGISVGPDGATHQALEDMATVRALPNMTVLAPADYEQTYKATMATYDHDGPIYIRFGREKVPSITTKKTPFKIGKADIYKEGKDVTIVACGQLVYEALMAAKKLEKDNIFAEVINSHTIKPIDGATIIRSAVKTGAVVTAEEHQVQGGMGSAVAEVLSQNQPVPMEFVGMQNTFGESGTPAELLDKYKMRSDDILKAVKKVLKRK